MKKKTSQLSQILRCTVPLVALCASTSCETADPNEPGGGDPEGDITVDFPDSNPNIVLIVADDMGYDDMSYRGNHSVNTPNLDALAQKSTRFENFYVHSVSAPTRASLLTGRHFLRCGISGMHAGRDFMNLDEVTIADALGKSGYETGMWGKWHSGKSDGYYPWQRGFDEAYMASLYHHDHNSGLYKGTYEGVQYNGQELEFKSSDGVWTDAKMTDMAIDFMTRNRNKKFFAFLPLLAPHEGWAAPDEYVEPYRQMGQSEKFATLNGMLSHLDHQVGRVVEAIESLGIDDNTVIIFMSDNGPNYNKTLLTASEWAQRNPSEYKGSKSKNTENGIHSPLFVYWKGKTVAIENKSLVGVCDLFPTLCDLAGASIPSNCKPLDGKSFYDVMESPSRNDMSRTLYISHWAPFSKSGECLDDVALTPDIVASIDPELQHIGIRRGYDKLLLNEYGEEDIALWDLSSDYKEQRNLYPNGTAENKAKATKYKSELISWYNGILGDDGAYTTTTFQIGDPNQQYTQILCYAPIDITDGLINESQKLTGFDTTGEGATYSVNVLRDGFYDLRIYLSGSRSVGDETFVVSTNTDDNIGEAKFAKNNTGSQWCKVAVDSEVKTLSIKLESSTSKEFDLQYIRLEYKGN